MVKQYTGIADKNGRMIMTDDVVRDYNAFNPTVHGKWVDRRVERMPGGYKLVYLRSETGQPVPEGSLAGTMIDLLKDVDLKTLLYGQAPFQVAYWEVMNFKPIEDDDDVMTLLEWRESVKMGAFIRSDGHGVFAGPLGKLDYGSDLDVFGEAPDWATHVVWYNK